MNTGIKRITVFAVCFSICASPVMPVLANPVGGTVVGGSATINGQGTAVTTINQTANRVIINWQDFSIGAGELTRFVQPSAAASALNRVVSGNPSLIYGSLQANGRVFVVNPNGILVGPGGQIDTKAFIASTHDIADASFMSGDNLIFSGNSQAGIKNEGIIKALGGDVYLIAQTVENAGTIKAEQGTVGLAAGSQVQLVQSGNERLTVLAGSGSAEAGVVNRGTIQAASAELKAAGGNIYALAINNGGVVRATGISTRNGRIVLTADGGNVENSGSLIANNANGSGGAIVVNGGHNASAPATVISSGTISARGDDGTKGGTVQVLGDHVGLVGNARVDVSGDTGGGTALIGGDFQGSNPNIQNASGTFVGADTRIDADAVTRGDGGKVVVWGNDSTRFYGAVNARGGSRGGNGGFVEVSGHYLDFLGNVSTLAPLGTVGTLLLDPTDLTINNANQNITGSPNFIPNGNPSTLSWATIDGALATSDVTITTVGSPNTGDPGDITIAAASPVLNRNNNLTITSARSITVNAASTIVNTGSGDLQLDANGGGVITIGAAITLAGDLVFNSQDNIAINSSLTAATVTSHSGTDGSGNTVFGAAVTVNANVQSYQAGNGTGGGTASTANLVNNAPAFRNTAGAAAPTTFTFRQDDNIANANIPAAAQFGAAVPGTYTIQSDDGTLTLSTGAKVANSALSLISADALTIDDNLTLASISAHSGTDGSGNLTFGSAALTIRADTQIYRAGNGAGGGTPTADLVGQATVFRNTADSGAPVNFTYRQDAAIADTAIPDISPSTSYTIQSDEGGVDLPALILPGSLAVIAAGLVDFVGATPTTIATTLAITTSAGGITDSGAGTLAVTGTSTLAAGAANSITLNNNNNFSTVAVTSGNNVTLNDINAIDLGASTISGTLNVTAAGPITDSGAVAVTGTTTLAAGAGNNITLDNADNFSTVILTSGNNVILNDISGIILGASTVAGTLNVTAAGTITDSGNVVVTGTTTLAAGSGNNILLDNNDNFSTVVVNSGNNVTLNDINAIDLGASTVSGTLNVTAIGAITDSGAVVVSGATATFAAGAANNITLDNADNFNAVLVTSGNNVILNDVNAIALGASTIAGTLNVTAGGAITDSGNVVVTGTTTLTAGANDITLDNNDNFSTVVINSANNVTLNDVNAIDLGASAISGTLNVTANGAITDSGNVIVNGATATFAAGAGNNITLNNNDDFNTVAITSGNNVNVQDIDGIDLGASTISGTFDVTAQGNITQSGALNVTAGASSFLINTILNGDVLLGSQANNFGNQTVTINAINGGTVRDVSFRNTSANAVLPAIPAVLRNLTLRFDAAAINQGVGAFNVTALASFIANGAAANGNITLNNPANSFGSLALSSANGTAVSVTEANDTALDTVTINNGTLTINSPGTITQVGGTTLTVGGLASFISTGVGAGGNITLNNAGNNFGSVALNSANGSAVSVTEASATALGNVAVNSGNLTVNSAGAITQVGGQTINVAGLASFLSSGAGANGNITLNNAGNNFGSLSLSSANGTAASVTEASATALENVSINAGSLSINSAGTINQIFPTAINVGGLATFTSTGAGANGDIFLDSLGNTFGSLGLNSANGTSVGVREADAMLLANINVGVGALTLVSGGNISQVGGQTINVAGGAIFAAPNGSSIIVGNAGNTFNSAVNFIGLSGGTLQDVTVRDTTDFDIVGITLNGNLSVNSGGQVSQSGAIIAPGLAVTAVGPVTLNGANQVGTIAGNVTGAGNTFSFSDQSPMTVGVVGGVSGITTANGAVTLNADAMTIASALDSGTARTTLQSLTSGLNIDLGSETAGKLSLTDAEFDQITAGVLQIGNATAGSIDVSAPITASGIGTLALLNNSTVSASGAGSLAVAQLRISGSSGVTLNGNNDVDTLAGTAATWSFTDVDDLTVGLVDGVSGISATIAGITLSANALAINNPVNGTIFGDVLLQTTTPGTAINLGAEAGGLSLTDAELDLVTARMLQIGNSTAGAINVAGAISPANVAILSLVNNAGISGGGSIAAPSLNIITPGVVALNGANDVDTLAASVTGAGNDFTFADTDDLIVGQVNTVVGITTAGGDVTLRANSMAINQGVNAGAGRANLLTFTAGRPISLGAEVPTSLSLSDFELDLINAGTLQIGDLNSGSMTIVGNISPASPILSLRSGGSIVEDSASTITVGSLNLQSVAPPNAATEDPLESGGPGDGIVVTLFGQNVVNQLSASGQPIYFRTFNEAMGLNLQVDNNGDLSTIGFVPVNSVIVRPSGEVFALSSASLAALSSAIIPAPKLDTSSFSGSSVSTDEAAQILPAGSIGTLWLQLPFARTPERRYKIEDLSKWTSGRIAAVGSTAGPQTPN